MGRWQAAREGGLLRPSTSHRLSRNADLKIPKAVDMSVLLSRNARFDWKQVANGYLWVFHRLSQSADFNIPKRQCKALRA